MTAIKLLAASLGLALIGTATVRADDAYEACLKTAKTNATNAARDCGVAYLKRAEAALNAAWKHTYGLVDGQTAKKDLPDEERAWIVFMEKSCTFYFDGDYGREGRVLFFPACRGQVIEERTKDLISIGKELAQP